MADAPAGAPLLSVVIAAHNEARNLAVLYEELAAALDRAALTYEVIVVDDASDDQTPAVLAGLARRHAALRVARHARNHGQSAALASGFHLARGELVLTMDADLQHDPADVETLLAALTADIACVAGYRAQRNDSLVRRASSRIANRFRAAITGDALRDAGCTFRLVRRQALAELPLWNGMHRFLPTLLRAQGLRVVELPIHHRPRRFGTAHYGIGNRLWRGIRDCFGVRWYQRRAFPARRLEIPHDGDEGAAQQPGVAARR